MSWKSSSKPPKGAKDLTDLRRIGTAAVAGETAFLAADRGNRTFAELIFSAPGISTPDPVAS